MGLLIQNFNINDLEQLSGVKAHTIRIWEKRYSILFPERTETNIRIYNIGDLQKILNISLLNNQGYKISRIAKLSDDEIAKMVKEVVGSESSRNRALNTFKVAMINLDQSLIHRTFEDLAKSRTFSQIFYEIFMPLLDEIGILWQTNSINPVHEHFLVSFLKEKLYLNIALLEKEQGFSNKNLYVLFLPEFENCDLRLLFLNYELKLRKHRTIFLSAGLPMKDLQSLMEIHSDPVFISYLTVAPKEICQFLREFESEISRGSNKELLLFGAKVLSLNQARQPSNIKFFKCISEFVGGLDLKRIN